MPDTGSGAAASVVTPESPAPLYPEIYAWARRYLGRDSSSISDATLNMDAAILVPGLLAVCADLAYPGGLTDAAERARFDKAAGLLLALEVEPARLLSRLDSGEGVVEEIEQGGLRTRYAKGGNSKQTRAAWTSNDVKRQANALLYGFPGVACFRAAAEAAAAAHTPVFATTVAMRWDCDPYKRARSLAEREYDEWING